MTPLAKAAEAVRVAIARGATPESIARAALDAVLADAVAEIEVVLAKARTRAVIAKSIASRRDVEDEGRHSAEVQKDIDQIDAALSALHDMTRG